LKYGPLVKLMKNSQLINIEPDSLILICSPFLSSPAVEKYLGLIETATRRGVKITIYTLSPDHRSIRDKEMHRRLIEKLRKAGAEVRERMNMHEKAVVALGDKTKVAYFGSLNPLSNIKVKQTIC
jgi:HKD family nuclease